MTRGTQQDHVRPERLAARRRCRGTARTNISTSTETLTCSDWDRTS